jgi:hypothetical protein
MRLRGENMEDVVSSVMQRESVDDLYCFVKNSSEEEEILY